MWPFTRKTKKKDRMVKKVVVGLVIGGAIGSIIGKKMMQRAEDESKKDEDEKS